MNALLTIGILIAYLSSLGSSRLTLLSWLPEWLGGAYARLYASHDNGLFSFEKAAQTMGGRNAKLVLSLLRRKGWLIVFGRQGRKRLYRLINPELALSTLALKASVVPKQGRYANLIATTLTELMGYYGEAMHSVAVFGSIARGAASPTSDLDVLVVADLEENVAKRIDRLVELEYSGGIGNELSWLKSHGVHCHVSWFPLTRREAARFRPLYLDMAEDAMIVYDRDDFLKGLLNELRVRLKRDRARRVWLDAERWYWSVKPDFGKEPLLEV